MMQLKSTVIIFYVVLLSRALNSFAAPAITDAEKKQRVEAMIMQFESKFSAPHIDAASAINMLRDENTLFVDAREDKEIAVSKIAGAISKKDFEQNPTQYKTRKIIAYCTIGYRSAAYVEKWNKRGYTMQNLRGSLLLWAHAGGALVDAMGAATSQVHVYGRDWDLLPGAYQGRF
jgi:rhodanese-related sulfurtransferase